MAAMPLFTRVLILVVMEDSLGQQRLEGDVRGGQVLILVVMEDSLGPGGQ